MRWITNKNPRPTLLETKNVKRFAWCPTQLEDNTTVWLESYIDRYRYEPFKIVGEDFSMDDERYSKKPTVIRVARHPLANIPDWQHKGSWKRADDVKRGRWDDWKGEIKYITREDIQAPPAPTTQTHG